MITEVVEEVVEDLVEKELVLILVVVIRTGETTAEVVVVLGSVIDLVVVDDTVVDGVVVDSVVNGLTVVNVVDVSALELRLKLVVTEFEIDSVTDEVVFVLLNVALMLPVVEI